MRLTVDEGADESGPVWKDEVSGDGGEVLKEALAGADARPRFLPGPGCQVAQRVPGEGEQVHGDQQGREVLIAVAEVVFEVVALGLEEVEALVLDLPPSPCSPWHQSYSGTTWRFCRVRDPTSS